MTNRLSVDEAARAWKVAPFRYYEIADIDDPFDWATDGEEVARITPGILGNMLSTGKLVTHAREYGFPLNVVYINPTLYNGGEAGAVLIDPLIQKRRRDSAYRITAFNLRGDIVVLDTSEPPIGRDILTPSLEEGLERVIPLLSRSGFLEEVPD